MSTEIIVALISILTVTIGFIGSVLGLMLRKILTTTSAVNSVVNNRDYKPPHIFDRFDHVSERIDAVDDKVTAAYKEQKKLHRLIEERFEAIANLNKQQ